MGRSLLLIIFGIIGASSVSAYIDPGTAGMIIGGGIWPFILAILAVIGGFFLKFFFKPIKKGVLSVWGKIKEKT